MKTYGVEVEFICSVGRHRIADIIKEETGIDIKLASYSDKNSNFWRLKPDASVHGTRDYEHAIELVTPILKGEEDMNKLISVVNVINEYSAVNRTCGLHVHIGVNELTKDEYKKLLKLWLKYESACDFLQPESRRSGNTYCRPNFGRLEYGAELIKSFKALNGAKDTNQLVNNAYFGEKYRKLNTNHYWRQGTVEFRTHSGTTSSDKINHWVRLTQAFVMAAQSFKGTNINKSADINTYRTKVMLIDFYKKILINKDTVKFYKKRYRELNNAFCR